MRVQLLFVVALAIVASVQAASPSPRPRPPAPTSFTCNSATASSLGDSISNSINEALLPNATNTITNSQSNPYWKFTVPTYCWDNVFGFGYQACTKGGTYQASTGKTTTVSGAFNMNVNVSLAQTSCTASAGAAGTWSATATWPKITFDAVVAIYPVTGGNIGMKIEMTVTNMVVKAAGSYSYTVNGSTNQLCITGLNATSSSITVADVSASAGLNGAPLTDIPNVASKIESQINAAGPKLADKLNTTFKTKIGKCKTVGTALPPRSPSAPRPPRGSGR